MEAIKLLDLNHPILRLSQSRLGNILVASVKEQE
jgi:hypothetical protein